MCVEITELGVHHGETICPQVIISSGGNHKDKCSKKNIFLCYSTSPQQRLTNVFGFHQIDTKFMKHKKDDEMERQ